jgi:hypothetical protein
MPHDVPELDCSRTAAMNDDHDVMYLQGAGTESSSPDELDGCQTMENQISLAEFFAFHVVACD